MSNTNYEKIAENASSWWVEAICNGNRLDNYTEKDLTATQIGRFQKQLYIYICQQLEDMEKGSSIVLGTDYAPCKPLADIAEACSISVSRFPPKITMEIGTNFCNVRAGYNSSLEYLYGTQEYFKDLVKSAENNLKYWEDKDDIFFEKWSDFSKQHIVAEAKSMVVFAKNLYSDYKSGKLKF